VTTTVVAGSLVAAGAAPSVRALGARGDVVLLATAAAFSGATEAALRAADDLAGLGARIEGLMVVAREDARDPYFARRVGEADLVVLLDGAALHARSVWRDSPVGEAIAASEGLVAIGDVASVLFEVMIDPRGGAPTTGLGYRRGIAVTTRASDDQLRRTRTLLGEDVDLVVLGPDGVVVGEGASWRVEAGEAEVTRGAGPGSLP
jgi:hypothetical protein